MDRPAVVSLTFDDGLRCQFDKAVPVLSNYRFPATFFLIANREPTNDSWSGQHIADWWKIDWRESDIAMLKKLVDDGHEIGSHSVTHYPDEMRRQPEIEVRDSKALIEGWIGTKVSSFCYPFYWSYSNLVGWVRKWGYEQARGGVRGSFYPTQNPIDYFNVDCHQVATNETVERWVRPGHWHVLTYHGIGGPSDGWEPITEGEFANQMRQLAGLRDAGAVEVVTFKDGADRLRRVGSTFDQTTKTE